MELVYAHIYGSSSLFLDPNTSFFFSHPFFFLFPFPSLLFSPLKRGRTNLQVCVALLARCPGCLNEHPGCLNEQQTPGSTRRQTY